MLLKFARSDGEFKIPLAEALKENNQITINHSFVALNPSANPMPVVSPRKEGRLAKLGTWFCPRPPFFGPAVSEKSGASHGGEQGPPFARSQRV